MRTHRSLALLVASLLFVVLASGVAAAETGDGGSLVGVLQGLIELLQQVVELLQSMRSMG